jgi:histidinol-phosphate aminotransferase
MIELNTLVRKNVRELQPYSCARDEFSGTEGVFLDANESPYGNLNRYPDPYQRELKSMLAAKKGIDPKQIFVGNGSDEAIDLLFRVFCEPGIDKALTFSPSYGMYEVSARINAVELIQVPLLPNFQIDMDQTLRCLKDEGIKLLFLCSPNNPSGNTLDRADIERILKLSGGIVVVDEAYIDFSAEESLLNCLETYPNLMILQTMSKARGLAAARVGFAFASPEIIALLERIKPPYNVSGLNQRAALEALRDEETFQKNLQITLRERAALGERLMALSSVKKVYPTDANFLLVEFADADQVYASLVEAQIVVRNRSALVRNCLRISVGTPEENARLIDKLNQIENEKSIVY